MSLLAEEIVEEWLNRQGYFTIRGVKIGVHEMDLLAIRCTNGHIDERRHIEVQASVNPISYVTRVPKEVQKKMGRAAGNAKLREVEELRVGIQEWIEKKYDLPEKKIRVRESLAKGPWTKELIVHRVKHPEETTMIAAAGITVRKLSDIIEDLKRGKTLLEGAAGAHLVELVNMAADELPTSI